MLLGYVVVLSGVLLGRSVAKEWSCDEVPAPQDDFAACGMSSSSWVCDPEHLLTVTEAFQINRMITAVQTMRSCVCENCGVETRFPNTYLKLSVAIVSDIRRALSSDEYAQVELAQFAECVRTQRWRHVGECQDEAIIVMATNMTENNITYISSSSGGGAVAEGVTAGCVDVIIRSNMDVAKERRYGDALFNIIEGIKNSLAGFHYCVPPSSPAAPVITPEVSTSSPPPRVSSRTWIIVGGSAGGFFFLAFCCCCCCLARKSRATKK